MNNAISTSTVADIKTQVLNTIDTFLTNLTMDQVMAYEITDKVSVHGQIYVNGNPHYELNSLYLQL